MADTTSSSNSTDVPDADQPKIDLKNPYLAAALSFVLPGAGHFYQGRIGKGIVFCVCVLGLFLYGLVLSSGNVGWGRAVYWKWTPDDHRFYFLGQACIGAPALPALIQSELAANGLDPFLYGFMAPPISSRYVVNNHGKLYNEELTPERLEEQNKKYNFTFHQIRKELNKDYELGTLFTTVAGLLNLLVAFDAAGGIVIEKEDKKKPKKEKDKK